MHIEFWSPKPKEKDCFGDLVGRIILKGFSGGPFKHYNEYSSP